MSGIGTPMNDTQILTIAFASVPTMRSVLIGRRFEEMKEMWRTELHRVEGSAERPPEALGRPLANAHDRRSAARYRFRIRVRQRAGHVSSPVVQLERRSNHVHQAPR